MERSFRTRLLAIDEVSQAFLNLLVVLGGDCTAQQRKSLQRPRPAVHAVRVSWQSYAPWSLTCRRAPRNTTPSRAVAAAIRWKVCFWSRNGARASPTSEATPSEGRQISAGICHLTRGCEPPLYHSITEPPRGGALTLVIGEGDALPDGSRVGDGCPDRCWSPFAAGRPPLAEECGRSSRTAFLRRRFSAATRPFLPSRWPFAWMRVWSLQGWFVTPLGEIGLTKATCAAPKRHSLRGIVLVSQSELASKKVCAFFPKFCLIDSEGGIRHGEPEPIRAGIPRRANGRSTGRRAQTFSPGVGSQAPICRSIELQATQVRRPTSDDQEPRTTSLQAKILLNIHVP